TTIASLGISVPLKGVTPAAPSNGGWNLKAARRQSASLGMIRLERIPNSTHALTCRSDPNCSIHPPTKARPYSPSEIAPLVSDEKLLLAASVTPSSTSGAISLGLYGL